MSQADQTLAEAVAEAVRPRAALDPSSSRATYGSGAPVRGIEVRSGADWAVIVDVLAPFDGRLTELAAAIRKDVHTAAKLFGADPLRVDVHFTGLVAERSAAPAPPRPEKPAPGGEQTGPSAEPFLTLATDAPGVGVSIDGPRTFDGGRSTTITITVATGNAGRKQ
jgi:hypothetical protein